jgi:hypothetical protein
VTEDNTGYQAVADAAAEAIRRGMQPVPVRDGTKRPVNSAWTHENHDYGGDLDAVRAAFRGFAERGASNIGLRLGEPSGGLIDIDLDHPKASRLKDYFLPPTPMRSGRPGRPASHYWYRATGDVLPSTRQYKMPDGSVTVELRSTGSQTLIPPSVHPSGEPYRWEGSPRQWRVPAEVRAAVLQVQVAFVALGAVLLDQWPRQGSRHEAYLALAGGLLRYGDDVHPWWERNAPGLIRILADAANDEDGPEQREREVMGTTLKRLRGETLQDKVTGWTRLGEIIGEEHAERARAVAFEIETLSGFRKGSVTVTTAERRRAKASGAEPEIEGARDPLEERETHWSRVDLGPYARGEIEVQKPTVLRRSDGHGLLYPDRTNMLVAATESGKTWVAFLAAMQVIGDGQPVLYIDLEDGPAGTVERLKALGMGHEDIQHSFTYLNPDQPLASMQQNRWGRHSPSDLGMKNLEGLNREIEATLPSLIVVDGMSVLYGLHGLDTNDVTGTDVINNWLKSLVAASPGACVVVIDHTGKGAQRGSQPIGSQHKLSMVQGSCIQVFPVEKPRRGGTGLLELIVIKDRPGYVRQVSQGREGHEIAALATVDSVKEGETRIFLDPPGGEEVTADLDADDGRAISRTQDGQIRADIERMLRDSPEGLSGLEMQKRLRELGGEFGHDRWKSALIAMLEAGVIEHNGKGNKGSLYTLHWPS